MEDLAESKITDITNTHTQTFNAKFINGFPEQDKIFKATGCVNWQNYSVLLNLNNSSFSEPKEPQTMYNGVPDEIKEEGNEMSDNYALHITNKRIDDAISQTRDIVEKGTSENKALFNLLNTKMDALDVKISALSEDQKETKSKVTNMFFFLGATVISIAGIAIAIYIGFSQISIGLTQISLSIAQTIKP